MHDIADGAKRFRKNFSKNEELAMATRSQHMIVCMCEHKSHIQSNAVASEHPAHTYLDAAATQNVRTPYATLPMCGRCADAYAQAAIVNAWRS